MATIVFCDRVRHIVQESRSEIAQLIFHAQQPRVEKGGKGCTCGPNEGCSSCPPIAEVPAGFIYVTHEGDQMTGGGQVALKASSITSFKALPGDGI